MKINNVSNLRNLLIDTLKLQNRFVCKLIALLWQKWIEKFYLNPLKLEIV